MLFGKKKKDSGADVRIYFASDLHGSTVCFKKFINAAQFYGANVLLMGGDMTGKAVMPIAEQADGSFLADQAGQTLNLKSREEVDHFVKRTTNMGLYPHVMTEAEYRRLKGSPDDQHELFKRLVLERVREWCDWGGEKLKGSNVILMTMPGNDDFLEIDEILSKHPAVRFHEMEVTELDGFQMLHVGGSNPTPWNTEREFTEDEYVKKFEQLAPLVRDMRRCVFDVHVPPHGTVLDQCPKLDKNLQVVYDMGNPVQMHAGSTAVRQAIEKFQPLLGLHGHIHEGRGRITIGKTVCVNPGSVYHEGLLQGILVALGEGGIKDIQLLQG